MPLHPDAKALISTPGHRTDGWEVAEVRDSEHGTIALGGVPAEVASVDTVPVAGRDDVYLTCYRAVGPDKIPLLWFPGGGFVSPPIAYDRTMRRLCLATGRDVYMAHYRLAPEHPFPAAFDDAPVLAEAVRGGGRIHVGGDSSGGNLAAGLLLHAGAGLKARIGAGCLVYPMLDATCAQPSYQTYAEGFGFTRKKSAWYFEKWLGDTDPRDSRASPYFADDLSSYGPSFIASAECDPLRDEGEAFAGRLLAAGQPSEVKRYAGMIHGFFQMPGIFEASRTLITDIADYLDRQD